MGPAARPRADAPDFADALSVEVLWRSIYHKHERRAHRFRDGRITLAGDAGHLNSPAGGQGMNSGLQDAHNLAWKLTTAVTHLAADADALLESYSELREKDLTGRSPDAASDRPRRTIPDRTTTPRCGPAPRPRRTVRIRRIRLRDPLRRKQTHPRALAAELGLPLINGDLAALTRFFNRNHYLALIRPDHCMHAGVLGDEQAAADEDADLLPGRAEQIAQASRGTAQRSCPALRSPVLGNVTPLKPRASSHRRRVHLHTPIGQSDFARFYRF
ncbi:MAG: FAD-dependent monooxygenase [Pseudonocardiaceae bacterium]